jgi:hypothetical protein
MSAVTTAFGGHADSPPGRAETTLMILTGRGHSRSRSCFVTHNVLGQTDPGLSRAPPNVAVDFNALGIVQCAPGNEPEARPLLQSQHYCRCAPLAEVQPEKIIALI